MKTLLFILALCIALPPMAYAEQWKFFEGRGYVICEKIKKRLESYPMTAEEAGQYGHSIVMSYPGWKEPPWEDLDPQQHKALIRELLKYQRVGADVYFGRKELRWGRTTIEMDTENSLNFVFAHGVRLQVWRTHLLNWLDGRQVLDGVQTVVQIRYNRQEQDIAALKRKRPDIPVIDWAANTFLVTDDLQGPDPRVGDGDGRDLLAPIRIFGGIPHWVSGYYASRYEATITWDIGHGISGKPFCAIDYKLSKRKEAQ